MPRAAERLSHEEAVRRIKGYKAAGAAGFIRWCEECLVILGEGGEPMVFRLWPEQRRAAEDLYDEKKTVVLKARQLGMTWMVDAFFLFRSLYWANREHRMVSINEVKASDNLERVRFLWRNLPVWTRPELEIDNSTTLKFTDTGSMIRALPNTRNAGRGDTLDGLFMDEDAQLSYSKEIVTSALPALEKRGGVLVRLSTAYGYGNDFEAVCHAAQRGERGYKFIFMPWTADPSRTQEWYDALKEDEGEDFMHQEYPATPDEAFLASGRPFFDMAIISAARQLKPAPYEDGELEDGEFIRRRHGRLRVWKRPDPKKTYAIFCDVSEGLAKGDWTVAYVVAAGDASESARWRGKCDTGELEEILWDLGHWYVRKEATDYDKDELPALVAVEWNNMGSGTALRLRDRGYPNLYLDRDLVTGKMNESRPGFYTSAKSRRIMLGLFQAAVRRGDAEVVDHDALLEMSQFMHRRASGAPEGPPDGHDDCVIARAGAHLMATRFLGGGADLPTTVDRTPWGAPLVAQAGRDADWWVRRDQERLEAESRRAEECGLEQV